MSSVDSKIIETSYELETKHPLTQEVKYLETDFKTVPFKGSNYKYSRITPISEQKIEFSGTSTKEVTFRVPTVTHNIAQSFLMFDISFGDQKTTSSRPHLCLDTYPFLERIKSQTERGEQLANLENLDKYLKVMLPRQTTMKEYMNSDPSSLFYPSDKSKEIVEADDDAGGLEVKLNNETYNPDDGRCGAYDTDKKEFGNGTSAKTNYIENQHMIRGTYTAATSLAQMSDMKAVTLPLSYIKNSFFSIDKSIMMTSNYTIDITLGNPTKYINLVSDITATAGDPVAYTGTVTISNIALYLATETNQDIVEQIRTQVLSSGLKINCPIVEISKRSETKSASITQTIELNRSKGNTLRRIIVAPFQYEKTAPLAFDNSNNPSSNAVSAITSYYSNFNNARIQNFDIDETKKMGWILYRKVHPYGDDAIPSRDYYYWNYAIEEMFDNKGCPLNNNVTGGKTLTNEQYTYDLVMTTTNKANIDFYRFIIYERTLLIGNGVTQFM